MSGHVRLREELDRRSLKPSDLAKALGMRISTVLRVLRGHQDVRLRDVAHVSKALGFKADLVLETTSILDGVANPQPLRKTRRARVQWV
jgi:transcriptional regulator with XRE-family HTH domain